MWLFICGAWLGGIVGIGILIFFQGANININNHENIMKDSKEEK